MTLRDCFEAHRGRAIGKIDHFFDVYEAHFARFRNTPVRLLEIGVDRGGSLELWRAYFGTDADIHGLDIQPAAAALAPEDCQVHTGSQDDAALMESLTDRYGPFDIVIDDASHRMADQIRSFELLYPRLSERGVYVCEDSFTSYWKEYAANPGGDGTFIAYAKRLVDDLHAFWAQDTGAVPSPFTRMTRGIHFYSGTVVFERQPADLPVYVTRAGDRLTTTSIADLKSAAAAQRRDS